MLEQVYQMERALKVRCLILDMMNKKKMYKTNWYHHLLHGLFLNYYKWMAQQETEKYEELTLSMTVAQFAYTCVYALEG